MLKRAHLFNFLTVVLLLTTGLPIFAETASTHYSKRESGLYKDIFDQNIYYEGTQYLHLERFYNDLFGIRKRALDVNAYDEVPDSSFFTNRHGRKNMSIEELKKGPAVNDGPSGKLTITKGKFQGVTPGFFVQDEKGDKYLLKFDPMDYVELPTGAEVITSRFMHALGYNVPQYTLAYFKKDNLGIEPGAKVYVESGFRKKLTQERLDEFLLFVPETSKGLIRASASLIFKGQILGPMPFQGRRKEDPEDQIDHKDRREIRALQVFSSWLNNNDTRESNSLDVVETGNGGKIRHYIFDFNSSLGARPVGPKTPEFGHEYLFDYGETLKTILSFGFWKKPWQKRWDEAGREVKYPSIGYFDNRHFDPGKFKTLLPYYPFKDLSRADGFWAAKQIMAFTDDDIKAIVSTGDFSDDAARDHLVQTLIERRDLIGRYWFDQANPLDDFQLSKNGDSYELRFEDLAVRHGFESADNTRYQIDVIGKKGRKGYRLAREESKTNSLTIRPEWLDHYPSIDLLIRTVRNGKKGWSPFVRVEIPSHEAGPHIAGIVHQD